MTCIMSACGTPAPAPLPSLSSPSSLSLCTSSPASATFGMQATRGAMDCPACRQYVACSKAHDASTMDRNCDRWHRQTTTPSSKTPVSRHRMHMHTFCSPLAQPYLIIPRPRWHHGVLESPVSAADQAVGIAIIFAARSRRRSTLTPPKPTRSVMGR